MTETAQIVVSGIVQGVGYRWWTVKQARALSLTGWVRNLYDGRVEILARGAPEALAALERACHEGPRSAHVTQVERSPRDDDPSLRGFEQAGSAAAPLAR